MPLAPLSHQDDRRKNVVQLTSHGRDTLQRADGAKAEAERRFLGALPPCEAARFARMLRALAFPPGDG